MVAGQLEAAVPPHELAERFHDRSGSFEKGFGSSGHGDEHDAVDALHPGLGQGIVGAVEARHELALVRTPDQVPPRAEQPAMIWAFEFLLVTHRSGFELVPAVRAGAEEGANDTIIAARDQQGNTGETKRLEITPFRDLALMANRSEEHNV